MRSGSRQTRRDGSGSETSCRDQTTGMRVKDKDETIVRGIVRITRHKAAQYQITTTRSGWVRLHDVVTRIMNEFAHVYGVHAVNSYVTPQRVIDLIMNAYKPRLGLLREHHSKAITWVRAWNKHEGLNIPTDCYEQRIENSDDVPRTAVYPTKWSTCANHIYRAGI